MDILNTSYYQEKAISLNNSKIRISTLLESIKKLSWQKKRMALHVIWAIINLTFLSFCFYNISGSDLEFLFLIVMFLYCAVYWMLACLLFDKIIGLEVDNLQK